MGLLIDKPAGWTSHDVVAVGRRRLGTRAVGHAGTLDPFATGLLIVLVGKATRLARFVEARPKRYRAVFRFGAATDSDDATGVVVTNVDVDDWPPRETMQEFAASFIGEQLQRPPAYSAKHVGGERSYALARRGLSVDLAPVPVRVDDLAIVAWNPPDLTVDAGVSKGTYVRALARDWGERAGIPAHCAALRRLAIGTFDVADAIAPHEVEAAHLREPATMVPDLATVAIDGDEARAVSFGRSIAQRAQGDGNAALVGDDGRMLAVAEARAGHWHPVVVFEPAA